MRSKRQLCYITNCFCHKFIDFLRILYWCTLRGPPNAAIYYYYYYYYYYYFQQIVAY